MRMSMQLAPQLTLTLDCTECGLPLPSCNRTHATDSDILAVTQNPGRIGATECSKCGQIKVENAPERG